ncbi:uncharacterized protein LOC119595469 [Penaeus monodon]|uniref:uncharacterized protein LOC119595469 n=1 Tax=Penaeus monodon TaxID=6687 RepID=UPI0018A75CE1|nr:uncharacterized protein LOC119595469 [Penaeus monodon]
MHHTGVDCFLGHFHVVCKRHTIKRFGCVFTCFSTRVVHIEPLKSLDASAFLNAQKELRATVHAWSGGKSIDDTCKQRGIEWFSNPLQHLTWEACGNGRFEPYGRFSLRSYTQRIDDDRLRTLFCEVEATMNSRPLTAIPGNVTEPEALTPNHALRMNVGDGIQVQTDDNASLDNTKWGEPGSMHKS